MAQAAERQGQLRSPGRGAQLHLAGALFLKETETKAAHVAYRGSVPGISDMLGGSTEFMFLPINEISSHLESGSLRALAVTHSQRIAQLPNMPTMREALGLTTMDIGAWQGLLVPTGTPKDVTQKLSAALQPTLSSADVRTRLAIWDRLSSAGPTRSTPTTSRPRPHDGPRSSRKPEPRQSNCAVPRHPLRARHRRHARGAVDPAGDRTA
ncbi:hypothetical protein BH11PSE4_BH11PSE4_44330 [soil metagenome]